MHITGDLILGNRFVRGTAGSFRAFDPRTGGTGTVEPAFTSATADQVDLACTLAEDAFDAFRAAPPETRAQFLEAIAQGLIDLGDVLVERVMAESGLPRPRVEGERGRTAGQLRLFASLVREGRWREVTIDRAQPDRAPMPRPDLRAQKIPIGPVAVFGASNFPLAFSVAGGDTASALAAGCPVVAKAHPSHPGTSELAGRVIQVAAVQAGLPEGVFSLVAGEGNAVGEALVQHPSIQAVGFTGSRRGGLALARLAAERDVPIPVFAEMSSINPVFLLPHALEERGAAIAQGLADSATLGSGQFCTKPGLAIGIAGPAWDAFAAAAASAFSAKSATAMLNPGIHRAFCEGTSRLASNSHVRRLATGVPAAEGVVAGQPVLFATTAGEFLDHPELAEEVFGPATLLITCHHEHEFIALASQMEGQLTAALHLSQSDERLARILLPVLERKAGRILVNGFPTGVEVSHAMVHGGPFPSTTDSRFTSVGAMAIERFLRPVCYQDLPSWLLPDALQDENPLGVERLLEGKRERV